MRTLIWLRSVLAAAAILAATNCFSETALTFYYPVAVGGPITKIMNDLVLDFHKENPDISIRPIYSGSYQDTMVKAITSVKGGDPPQLSVILSTDMFSLIDEDAIIPFDEIVRSDADKAWLQSFYPALMANSQTGGKTWGVPFQRSTIVMFWNKDAYRAAGLDPEHPPKTWDELVEMGQKLTLRDAAGNVTQWGLQIPSSGFPYWLFQGLTTQNGATLMNQAGNEVYFNRPEVVEALQFWIDLARTYKIHPPGIVEWGTTPRDFFERKVATMWTTTGNLTNVRTNAKFEFGVAMLPARKTYGSPTGGGNFYIFKNSTDAQRAAALTFVKWMTAPERAAQWAIATGYVAVTPAAWQANSMKSYLETFAAPTVARDQLSSSVAELSTHDNQRVTKVRSTTTYRLR
jgi:sn-glycerol 3-phosphate transport system substrate-binding protein